MIPVIDSLEKIREGEFYEGMFIKFNKKIYLIIGCYNNGVMTEYALVEWDTFTIGATSSNIRDLLTMYWEYSYEIES